MAQVLIAAIPGNILYSHVPCKKVVFFCIIFNLPRCKSCTNAARASTHFLTSRSCLLISKRAFLLYFALVFMHCYQVAPVHELIDLLMHNLMQGLSSWQHGQLLCDVPRSSSGVCECSSLVFLVWKLCLNTVEEFSVGTNSTAREMYNLKIVHLASSLHCVFQGTFHFYQWHARHHREPGKWLVASNTVGTCNYW